jgi:hypothetical protein
MQFVVPVVLVVGRVEAAAGVDQVDFPSRIGVARELVAQMVVEGTRIAGAG